MPSTASCFSSPCGKRAVASEDWPSRRRPVPSSGSLRAAASSVASPTASRCSCATSSSTLRKWLATSVVTVGSSVRNASTRRSAFSSSARSLVWSGRRTCSSNISTASAGDRAGRVVVTAREREQVGEREAGLEQPQPGAQHVGVGGGVAGHAVALLRRRSALRARPRRAAARARRRASRARRG